MAIVKLRKDANGDMYALKEGWDEERCLNKPQDVLRVMAARTPVAMDEHNKVLELIRDKGPLTGREIIRAVRGESHDDKVFRFAVSELLWSLGRAGLIEREPFFKRLEMTASGTLAELSSFQGRWHLTVAGRAVFEDSSSPVG